MQDIHAHQLETSVRAIRSSVRHDGTNALRTLLSETALVVLVAALWCVALLTALASGSF